MPDIAEQILEATDILINERIKEISYDQTVIATIVDTSEAATKKKYRVSYNGTVMDVYSDITDYKESEQVRVLVPGGDWTQPKYIDGRYIPHSIEDSAESYVSILDTVLDLSGNLVNKGEEKDYNLIANNSIQATDDNRKSEILLWESENLSFIPGSLYDTWFIKARIQTELGDTVSFGEYGLRIAITFITTSGERIVNTSVFPSAEMFGNPFYFEMPSLQMKKFSISTSDSISLIRIYLYQNGNFIGLNPEIQSNIKVESLYLGFGTEGSKVLDNSIQLYTNNSLIYTDTTDDVKIGLLWYNKTEDNKYIGFSDGSPIDMFPDDNNDIILENKKWVTNNHEGQTQAYTESLYRKITAENTRLTNVLQTNNNTVENQQINTDIISLRLAADAIDIDNITSNSSDELNIINTNMKYIQDNIAAKVVPEDEDITSFTHKDELFGIYNAIINQLTTVNSLWISNLYNTTLIQANLKFKNEDYSLTDSEGNNYINLINTRQQTYQNSITTIVSKGKVVFNPNTDNEKIITYSKGLVKGYFNILEQYVKNSKYESEYNKKVNIITSSVQKLLQYQQEFTTLITTYVNPNNYLDIIESDNISEFKALFAENYNHTNHYTPLNYDEYNNRYSILWYQEDRQVTSDEFIPAGGWKLLDEFTNYGLPNWLTKFRDDNGNTTHYNYEKTARVKGNPPDGFQETAMITLTNDYLSNSEEIQRFKALVFFNHQIYESNPIEFKNGKAILPTVITDDYTIGLEHGLNSQESYQLYNSNHDLVNAAAAYKQRQVQLVYNQRLGGRAELVGATAVWTIPTSNTMLQFDYDELTNLGLINPTQGDGYLEYEKTIESTQDKDWILPYHIKPFYSSTYGNNTINCKINKTNGVTYETSINFIFSAYGTEGNVASLLVAPTIEAAAVTESKALNIQYKLFNYNGLEFNSTSNLQYEILGDSYSFNSSDFEISHNTNDTKYYGVLKLQETDTKTIGYLPIGYSSNPNYYYEGPSVIMYDAQGHNPTYYKEQCRIYENNDAGQDSEITGLSWEIVHYNSKYELDNSTSQLKPYLKDNKLIINNIYVDNSTPAIIIARNKQNKLIWAQSLYFDINKVKDISNNENSNQVAIGNSGTVTDTVISAPVSTVTPEIVEETDQTTGETTKKETLNGLVIGDIVREDSEAQDTKKKLFGIFGYSQGRNTYSFDANGQFTLNGETIKIEGNKISFLDLSEGALKTIINQDGTEEVSLGGGIFNASSGKGAWINSDTYGQLDLKAIAEWVAAKMQQENQPTE